MIDKVACEACVKDPFLKERIRHNGRIQKCDYCSSFASSVVITVLATWVRDALRQEYEEGEVVPFLDDDRMGSNQSGEEFQDVLSAHFGAENALFADILSLLTAPGDESGSAFSTEQRYVEVGGYRLRALREWEEIKQELRHHSRYYNKRAKTFFDNLLKDIKSAKAGGFFWNDVIRTVTPSEGHTIYRARLAATAEEVDAIVSNPTVELGPPPRQKASAGRMNFEGSSIFYGALQRETCIAELRPSLSSTIVSAKFKLRDSIRVLDLLTLDRSRHDNDLSLFQPDYCQRRISRSFMRHFHDQIRKPVLPGQEHEYLITQVLSDYLRNASSYLVDGMFFSSVQRIKGTNLVLFNHRGDSGDSKLALIPNSVRVDTVEEITYSVHPKRRGR